MSDAVVVAFVVAGTLVSVAASELDDGDTFRTSSIGDLPPGALFLLAIATLALWWRRSRPLTVTVVAIVITLVWAVAGYGDGQDLPLVVAAYSVGRHCSDHRRSLAAVTAACLASVLGSLVDTSQRIDVLPAILITVVPWYVGRRIRNRGDYVALLRERNERLEAEQQERARRAVAAERARIARELHDVVAHQVSMMTVQAGAAKTIARDDPDTAVDAMDDVEQAGRKALGELRHLLTVLHREDDTPEQLGPQPGFDDIPALVEELRLTGAAVTVTQGALPADPPTALELSGYRIVQESFTNIIKHAGPAPAVDVEVGSDDEFVTIVVTNTIDPAPARLPASGFGIVGMRERASLLGGSLDAGRCAPDRFRVRARLPLEPEPR